MFGDHGEGADVGKGGLDSGEGWGGGVQVLLLHGTLMMIKHEKIYIKLHMNKFI